MGTVVTLPHILLWLLLLLIHAVCIAGNLATQPLMEQGSAKCVGVGSFSFSVVSREAHTPSPGAVADRQKGSLGPGCAVRLSKQKCGHPVSFEFQMNKEHFFSLTMPLLGSLFI